MSRALHEDLSPPWLAEAIGGLQLIDQHAHAVYGHELSPTMFGDFISESDRPAAPGTSRFDSQLGVAIRRWCAPVLGLPALASAHEYLARRAELGAGVVTGRLLSSAGLGHVLVDTGLVGDGLLDLAEMAEASGARTDEIVRLEQVAEQVIVAGSAAGFARRFADALGERAATARAVKSIVGYRYGLDFDPSPPSGRDVTEAVGRWLRALDNGAPVRLADPVLLRHLLWTGVGIGLPVQIHTGFGDPDLDLRRCDPLLLRDFLVAVEDRAAPIVLLHCYPYHRQAGYLAHAYPHVYLDVGLAVHYTGARSGAVIAESLELAPFSKVMYSSDAFGLAELYFLGSALWRRGMCAVFAEWVSAGEFGQADAIGVAEMVGVGTARRVYRLG